MEHAHIAKAAAVESSTVDLTNKTIWGHLE